MLLLPSSFFSKLQEAIGVSGTQPWWEEGKEQSLLEDSSEFCSYHLANSYSWAVGTPSSPECGSTLKEEGQVHVGALPHPACQLPLTWASVLWGCCSPDNHPPGMAVLASPPGKPERGNHGEQPLRRAQPPNKPRPGLFQGHESRQACAGPLSHLWLQRRNQSRRQQMRDVSAQI